MDDEADGGPVAVKVAEGWSDRIEDDALVLLVAKGWVGGKVLLLLGCMYGANDVARAPAGYRSC